MARPCRSGRNRRDFHRIDEESREDRQSGRVFQRKEQVAHVQASRGFGGGEPVRFLSELT